MTNARVKHLVPVTRVSERQPTHLRSREDSRRRTRGENDATCVQVESALSQVCRLTALICALRTRCCLKRNNQYAPAQLGEAGYGYLAAWPPSFSVG